MATPASAPDATSESATSDDPAAQHTASEHADHSDRDQARAVLSLIQGFAGADPGPGGDCQWCPICRAARALRDGRPDVAEHLTDAVSAALAAVKALNAALDSAAAPAPAKSETATSETATSETAAKPSA